MVLTQGVTRKGCVSHPTCQCVISLRTGFKLFLQLCCVTLLSFLDRKTKSTRLFVLNESDAPHPHPAMSFVLLIQRWGHVGLAAGPPFWSVGAKYFFTELIIPGLWYESLWRYLCFSKFRLCFLTAVPRSERPPSDCGALKAEAGEVRGGRRTVGGGGGEEDKRKGGAGVWEGKGREGRRGGEVGAPCLSWARLRSLFSLFSPQSSRLRLLDEYECSLVQFVGGWSEVWASCDSDSIRARLLIISAIVSANWNVNLFNKFDLSVHCLWKSELYTVWLFHCQFRWQCLLVASVYVSIEMKPSAIKCVNLWYSSFGYFTFCGYKEKFDRERNTSR